MKYLALAIVAMVGLLASESAVWAQGSNGGYAGVVYSSSSTGGMYSRSQAASSTGGHASPAYSTSSQGGGGYAATYYASPPAYYSSPAVTVGPPTVTTYYGAPIMPYSSVSVTPPVSAGWYASPPSRHRVLAPARVTRGGCFNGMCP